MIMTVRNVVGMIILVIGLSATAYGQNCCAPSVPPQGVLGETVALPQTLEVGMHYEYLRSNGLYEGSSRIDDPGNTTTEWKRLTLTMSYGITSRFGVATIVPYLWKEKNRDLPEVDRYLENTTEGFGDVTVLVRYSPIARDFVTYRELSVGLGVKLPTGATDCRNFGFLLPEELQPGTGSWDFQGSVSFYQGFEPVDFFVSGTYSVMTEHDGYEFGNSFSYLATAGIHVHERVDVSAAVSGMVRGKDREDGEAVESTGRHQLWLVPGVQVLAIPEKLRLQAFLELPIYQHFDGYQVGSDFSLRLTAVYTLPLGSSDED